MTGSTHQLQTNAGMIGGTVGAQIQQGFVVLGIEGVLDWANV
jgi:outer membrane immunogenic protein